MIPSVTFLLGCWVGCVIGLFLAGALSAARGEAAEVELSSFPATRANQVNLALIEEMTAEPTSH